MGVPQAFRSAGRSAISSAHLLEGGGPISGRTARSDVCDVQPRWHTLRPLSGISRCPPDKVTGLT